MNCLGDSDLEKILLGTLDPSELARVDAHIDHCALCRGLVADLVMVRCNAAPVHDGGDPQTPGPAGLVSSHPPYPQNPDPPAPEVARRYVLLDLIGHGGMGRVYRAMDRLTGETVALKRVSLGPPAAEATRAGHRDALAREFRTLATLRHPSIVSVLDYGFDAERRPYFTMELLTGATPVLSLPPSSPFETRIGLLVQLLRALGYLHRRRILHGDLKPSNLLIVPGAEGPVLKVVDFGLCSSGDEARRQGGAGTLPYMAPELLCGGRPSAASDLYAVGVLACELLSGHHPFRGGATTAELIARVLGHDPDLSRLPPALGEAIGRALCRSPTGRPPDAATLLDELSRAAGVTPRSDPAPARDSYLMAARFTGRDGELAELRRLLHAAHRGRGSAWLLGGESGVGKSRLLDELRSEALMEGALAVRGQGLRHGGAAYHVWRGVLELLALHVELSDDEASVLGAVLPNLGALLDRAVPPLPELDVQITRSRVLHVLREVVERSRDPVLVLLEDLQWADAESLALLARVSEDLERVPLLVVASHRDDEAPQLPAELPAMGRLRLERFDRQGITDLCEAMLGPGGRDARLVDLVARETEGNAYFIVEVLRALAEEAGGLGDVGRRGLPERVLAGGIERVFERRLARVPAEARTFLDLAAVAGRQLDLDVLGASTPRVPALVQASAEVGVLEVHEQRWRFSHDQLRERILGGLDDARRRALHARVAEGLEATHPGSDAEAGRIAYHYREAARAAPAARYYLLAGEAALTRGALGEANEMLEQARALHGHVEVPILAAARVWRGLCQARFGLGQLAEADVALRRLCALLEAPLPERRRDVWLSIGRAMAEQAARRAGAARYLRLDTPDEHARTRREELLLGLWIQEVYVWLVEPEILLLCTLRGLNLEEALDTRQRTNFRSALAFLLSYTPARGLGRRYLERVTGTLTPGTQAEIDALRVQAIIAINDGRCAEAADHAARAVACARAYRNDVSLMHSLLQLQFATAGLDRYAEVLEIADEIGVLAARTRNPRFAALALIGEGIARIHLGDLSGAEAALDRAGAAPGDDLGPLPPALGQAFAAFCALRQGRQARALSLAGAAFEAVVGVRWAMLEMRPALFCILEVYLADDTPERPLPRIRAALAELHRIARRFPLAQPAAFQFQGRYEQLCGSPARAAASLRRSLRAAERLGCRYEQALTRYWLARLAQGAARRHVPEGPSLHLHAALALFEQLACPWDAARTRRALVEAT